MIRNAPDDEQVRAAMDQVLAEADSSGRRPTVTAVEERLGITHATFYRNYPDLIDWFKQQVAVLRDAAKPSRTTSGSDPAEIMARLRRENEDLRRLVKIYAESIRQLTVDNTALRTAVNDQAGITDLAAHRARKASDPDDR